MTKATTLCTRTWKKRHPVRWPTPFLADRALNLELKIPSAIAAKVPCKILLSLFILRISGFSFHFVVFV